MGGSEKDTLFLTQLIVGHNYFNDPQDYVSIFVPITIKKRGGRGSVSIITPQNNNKLLSREEKPNYDFRLVNALVKARKLQQKMDQNPNQTISSLATKEGLTHGYLGRLLRLNLLAPDIVEAILGGKQPKNLKLIDFLRKGIPLLWEEQKERFEFSFSAETYTHKSGA